MPDQRDPELRRFSLLGVVLVVGSLVGIGLAAYALWLQVHSSGLLSGGAPAMVLVGGFVLLAIGAGGCGAPDPLPRSRPELRRPSAATQALQ